MFRKAQKSMPKGLRIIIVGCGKVGTTLIEQLSREGHDITIIDQNGDIVQTMSSLYDVMGDERTYDYAVALRAVNTVDFMTAESAEIPWEVLQTVMSRIINEVRGVNRVFYDLTSKPPGTIEFE